MNKIKENIPKMQFKYVQQWKNEWNSKPHNPFKLRILPKLQSDSSIFKVHSLQQEIDTNGSLVIN